MSGHNAPVDGAECASCMDDITEENYAEYQAQEGEEQGEHGGILHVPADHPCAPGGAWLPSMYCSGCLDIMLQRKWEDWKNLVINTKCEAEWRRLLKVGPPINLRVSAWWCEQSTVRTYVDQLPRLDSQ